MPLTGREEVVGEFVLEVSLSVADRLEASLSDGGLFSSTYETVERGVRSYRYSFGLSEIEVAPVPRAVRQWVWKDKVAFINMVISCCPSLGDGIEAVMATLAEAGTAGGPGEDPERADRLAQKAVDYLSVYVLSLTDRLLETEEADRPEVINEAARELLDDLAGKRPMWDLKVFLKCLWMHQDEVEIGDGLRLRRPRADDYLDRGRVEGVPLGGSLSAEEGVVGTSVGAVLEFECGPATEAEAREELNVIMDTLMLFRVASLGKEHLEARSRSVLFPVRLGQEDEGTAPVYHAVVRAEDREDLLTFVRTIAPLVRERPFSRAPGIDAQQRRNIEGMRKRHSPPDQGPNDDVTFEESLADIEDEPNNGPEDLAFHLYRRSLLDIMSVEERIAKSISGLEELFLDEDSSLDRRRAVALRTSSLLEGWGHDALKVAKDIREGFLVRKALYGGEAMTQEIDLELLSENLAEYLRASIVIFLQARRSLTRERLIDAIDRLVQGEDLPEDVGRTLEGIFVNEPVPQPYR
jgi:hypothetical protein